MVRIIVPHGFGDVIQAEPYLRQFAAEEGEQLDMFVMERLPACRQVLSGQPYVSTLRGCMDPWNDANPPNTVEGFETCMAWMREYHDGEPLYTRRPASDIDPRWAKSLRIASELGVEAKPAKPLMPIDKAERAKGRQIVEDMRFERSASHIALVHGTTGNPKKDIKRGTLDFLARTHFLGQRVRLHTHAFPLLDENRKPHSVQVHIGAIEAADLFVGADSGPAHLASTTDTDVVWCFSTTPIEQAVPLYKRKAETRVYACGPLAEELKARWERWASHNGHLIECAMEVRTYRGN